MEKQSEILAAQNNTPQLTSYEIIKRDRIEGTPFEIVTTEQGSFGAFGKYRLTEFMEFDQVQDRILCKDWEILFSVMIALINHSKTETNE